MASKFTTSSRILLLPATTEEGGTTKGSTQTTNNQRVRSVLRRCRCNLFRTINLSTALVPPSQPESAGLGGSDPLSGNPLLQILSERRKVRQTYKGEDSNQLAEISTK